MDLLSINLIVILIVQKLSPEEVIRLIDNNGRAELNYQGNFRIELEGARRIFAAIATIIFDGVESQSIALDEVRFRAS